MSFDLRFQKYNVIMIFIILIFSIQYYGQSITNKKIVFEIPEKLNKQSSEYFVSEINSVPLENKDPFVAIGFNAYLSRSNMSNIYIRTSVNKIDWSDWQILETEQNFSAGDKIFYSHLYFFDKSIEYFQFKIENTTLIKKVTFSFINPGKTPLNQLSNNLKLSKVNNSNSDERPAFVNRKAWECPQSENVSSRTLTNVTHLIIHHSAGNTVSNDFAAVVRAYWDYHVNSNGWDDIGYNWLVDPNGVLYKGRAWKSATEENVMGAHNSGKNGNTAGICFIGNYVSNIPSQEGLDKIADISSFLSRKYDIDPTGESYHAAIERVNDNIDGHGQSGGGTACPGTQIINRLQLIRDKTYEKFWDTAAAPEIIASYPSSETDSAYLTKPVLIEFSHPMNKTTVENAFSINPAVDGSFGWNESGNILSFTPADQFSAITDYSTSVSTNAETFWGVKLDNNFEFSFVTKEYDNLSLLSSYPKNGDTEVDLDLTLELLFDGPILANSLSGRISFVDEDSASVSISVDVSAYPDGIIRFSTVGTLNENSNYYIYLKKGISTTDGYTLRNDRTISFTTKTLTSIKDNEIINTFKLSNAYPNPFNPSTNISYSIPGDLGKMSSSYPVKLVVFDALGNEVVTLVNQRQASGNYSVKFNAADLSSGIFYYRLIIGSISQTKKMILLK